MYISRIRFFLEMITCWYSVWRLWHNTLLCEANLKVCSCIEIEVAFLLDLCPLQRRTLSNQIGNALLRRWRKETTCCFFVRTGWAIRIHDSYFSFFWAGWWTKLWSKYTLDIWSFESFKFQYLYSCSSPVHDFAFFIKDIVCSQVQTTVKRDSLTIVHLPVDRMLKGLYLVKNLYCIIDHSDLYLLRT